MTGLHGWIDVVRRGRGAWIVLFAAGFMIAGASAVSAYWTVSTVVGSSSTAFARAGSLSAPTSATAVDLGGGTVSVSWTTISAQVTGASYVVTRSSGPGSPVVVCTVASSITTCSDTGLAPASTYGYTVSAVIGSAWHSTTATAATTTLGVTTSTLPSGTVGSSYAATLTAVGLSGAGTQWSVTSGALPPWATLDAASGTISGTPNVASTTSGLVLTVTDSTHRTASSAVLSLTVNPAAQTVAFTSNPPGAGSPTAPGSAVVGVGSYTPTAVSTSGLAVVVTVDPSSSTVCSMTSGVVTFVGPGSCVIDADQPGNADYLPAARVQQTIAVTRLPQSISFTSTVPAGATAGTTYAASATASSGLVVTLSIDPTSSGVCTISGGTVSLKAVGQCTIDADQAGNATYDAAPRAQLSFTVRQGSQTISLPVPLDAGVTGTWTPVAVASSGLPVGLSISSASSSVCRLTAGVVSFLGAGSCTITATQAGTADFSAATLTQTFEVSTPAGIGIVITGGVGGTGLPVATCGAVSANATCTISGTGLSGTATFTVVGLSASGHLVVLSYAVNSTVTESGQDTGTATIAKGASSTAPTTLTASHVGNAPKTTVITVGTFKLTLNIVT